MIQKLCELAIRHLKSTQNFPINSFRFVHLYARLITLFHTHVGQLVCVFVCSMSADGDDDEYYATYGINQTFS